MLLRIIFSSLKVYCMFMDALLTFFAMLHLRGHVSEGEKMGMDSIQLELEIVGNCHVDAEKQT